MLDVSVIDLFYRKCSRYKNGRKTKYPPNPNTSPAYKIYMT